MEEFAKKALKAYEKYLDLTQEFFFSKDEIAKEDLEYLRGLNDAYINDLAKLKNKYGVK